MHKTRIVASVAAVVLGLTACANDPSAQTSAAETVAEQTAADGASTAEAAAEDVTNESAAPGETSDATAAEDQSAAADGTTAEDAASEAEPSSVMKNGTAEVVVNGEPFDTSGMKIACAAEGDQWDMVGHADDGATVAASVNGTEVTGVAISGPDGNVLSYGQEDGQGDATATPNPAEDGYTITGNGVALNVQAEGTPELQPFEMKITCKQ